MYPGYFAIDPLYIILIVPALILTALAQANVSSTFSRYSRVRTARGLTGAEAARAILDANGLHGVRIEQAGGSLTDHYDPRANVIRLSQSVYSVPTVAAVGVAAHEAGHAVQYAEGYLPIRMRNALVGVTNIGSQLSMPLILLGLVFSFYPLVQIGIFLFSGIAFFQLITLPVELNASSRALTVIDGQALLDSKERQGAKKVLTAAALTYVAALITSLLQLLRLVLRFGRRRDD